MPKISVIVPNYNHAEFLHRRIDSILQQTCQDFELILLDDCSTDDSVSILQEYEQNGHVSHIVVNAENSGSPFVQWQRGFDLAHGEYICVAESDDWWEPTILETLREGMREDVVLSVCQANTISDEGKLLYKTDFGVDKTTVFEGRDFVRKYLFGDTMLVNSGMCMFRKDVLKYLTGEHKEFHSAGDWMFWVQVAMQGKVAVCPEYLNNFRRNPSTVSSHAEYTGVDMMEGNRICRYVARLIKPTFSERWKAMKQRYALYVRQLPMYESEEIRRSVWRDLVKTDLLVLPIFLYKKLKK